MTARTSRRTWRPEDIDVDRIFFDADGEKTLLPQCISSNRITRISKSVEFENATTIWFSNEPEPMTVDCDFDTFKIVWIETKASYVNNRM